MLFNPFTADDEISGIFLDTLLEVEETTEFDDIIKSKSLDDFHIMKLLQKRFLVDHYKSIFKNDASIKLDTHNLTLYESLQTKGHAKINLLGLDTYRKSKYEALFNYDLKRLRKIIESSESELVYIPFEDPHYKLAEDILFKSLNASTTFDKIFGRKNWELVGSHIFGAKQAKKAGKDRVKSSIWHRDHRGRMLKLWITVYVDEGSPKTKVISGSHVHDPRIRGWEQAFKQVEDPDEPRNKLYSVCKNALDANPKLSTLDSNKYDVLIIDTNAIHRGDYEPKENIKEGVRIRYELIIRSITSGNYFDFINISLPALVSPTENISKVFSKKHLEMSNAGLKNMYHQFEKTKNNVPLYGPYPV